MHCGKNIHVKVSCKRPWMGSFCVLCQGSANIWPWPSARKFRTICQI